MTQWVRTLKTFCREAETITRKRAMDEPTYEVDEDTRELLTEVLSLAQRVIDLQYDDDTADSLEDMLIVLSNRF